MSGLAARRARVVGLALILAAFGLGALAGAMFARRPGSGVVMTVITTDAIPRELEELGLTEPQREEVRALLRAGRPRVLAVMDEFEPRVREALEMTEHEIEAVLTPEQRARWQEFRRQHPPRTDRQFIRR